MINIPNACWPKDDLLVGGQPSRDDLNAARDAGFKTIVNIRGLGEDGTDWEPDFVNGLGLNYHHIPVSGPMDLTEEKAQLLMETIESSRYPLMIHCASGNRVGALFAINAFIRGGVSRADALQIGTDAGLTKLRPFVEGLLGDL
ncbi:MAG: protein tyrosine phosphatase family protein [Myxococcota bacterium]|nr:protein tyrosine phosphatase family protein [Myxococcota bacterium]